MDAALHTTADAVATGAAVGPGRRRPAAEASAHHAAGVPARRAADRAGCGAPMRAVLGSAVYLEAWPSQERWWSTTRSCRCCPTTTLKGVGPMAAW
jgi:hypothetical protein